MIEHVHRLKKFSTIKQTIYTNTRETPPPKPKPHQLCVHTINETNNEVNNNMNISSKLRDSTIASMCSKISSNSHSHIDATVSNGNTKYHPLDLDLDGMNE